MRLSKFRSCSVFTIAALFAGSFVLPTIAKESIKVQPVQPVLLAQNATAEPESIDIEDVNAAETASGAAIRNNIRTFFNTASPNVQIGIFLPVEDFTYINGGVGEPNGSTNRNLFDSFFKAKFGVLCGANNTVLNGFCFSTATSAFSPDLTQTDINKIKSVKVKFDYAFLSDSRDRLELIVRNVTQRKNTFETQLVPTPGKTITEDITEAFTEPGRYILRYRLIKSGATDNDTAGFNNVILIIATQ